MKHTLTTALVAGATFVSMNSCKEKTPQYGVDPVEDVIAAMTLEEKVDLLVGSNRKTETPPDSPKDQYRYPTQCEMGENAVASQVLQESRVQGAAGQNHSLDRLGIPPFVLADGPAGLRIDPKREGDQQTYYCTAFPIESALSASWDVDLVERVADAMGNEVLEYGADVLLAPAINIHRSPLCGRNFEYFSEDPYLVGTMATAYIKGVQKNQVGVSLKHFAVNNQETHRNGVDAQVSMRAMREIYLRGFEMAVKEAKPWTIMSSYNKINGVFASENKWLLTDLLRDEWGFEGYVMTDWWAQEHGDKQMEAGNDLIMPGTQRQYDEIVAAVREGRLDEKIIDRNLSRILTTMLPSTATRKYPYTNKPDLEAHAQVTREAAAECMVLLANDGTLPLSTTTGDHPTYVTMYGNAGYDPLVGGSGSGNVNRAYKISFAQGLTEAGYYMISMPLQSYSSYIQGELSKVPAENFWTIPVAPEMPLEKKSVEVDVAASDVVIWTLCRMAGEGGDRKVVPGDYLLSEVESQNLKMVSEVAHRLHKPLVIIFDMGNIIDMTEILAAKPNAILHAWMGGQEMGNSVADVISGKVNPSGRLPMTWAKSYKDYPSQGNFPFSDGRDDITRYEEDIYVGYRHFDRAKIQPLYPFGFGLSYTDFAFSDLETEEVNGSQLNVNVTVTNTGKYAGKEVVQIYANAPAGKDYEKPVKELKAYAKTPLLQPGESVRMQIPLDIENLASWSEEEGQFVIDAGKHTIMAAASAADIRLTTTYEVKMP